MRDNPRELADIGREAVCREHGITCTQPKRGDLYKISHASQPDILTIPAKRPIKPFYIRKLIAFIERVRESGE